MNGYKLIGVGQVVDLYDVTLMVRTLDAGRDVWCAWEGELHGWLSAPGC